MKRESGVLAKTLIEGQVWREPDGKAVTTYSGRNYEKYIEKCRVIGHQVPHKGSSNLPSLNFNKGG